MKTSANGIALIKKNEGLVLKVYNDNGKQAIGYGHDLLPGETYPNGITEAIATTLLVKDLAHFEFYVNKLAPNANQNQFDALMDFCYNLGPERLDTMLHHGWDQIPTQILLWNRINGVPNKGLLARRQGELELFQTPIAQP